MEQELHQRRYSRILSEILKDYQLIREPIIQFGDIRNPMEAKAVYFNSKIEKLIIKVNPNIFSEVDDDIILGGLAHELTHLEDYSNKTRLDYFLVYFKYNFSRKYKRKVERSIDLRTIAKGKRQGHCLLKNREYRYRTMPKERFDKMKDFYLSPDEIKKEIQRIWQ